MRRVVLVLAGGVAPLADLLVRFAPVVVVVVAADFVNDGAGLGVAETDSVAGAGPGAAGAYGQQNDCAAVGQVSFGFDVAAPDGVPVFALVVSHLGQAQVAGQRDGGTVWYGQDSGLGWRDDVKRRRRRGYLRRGRLDQPGGRLGLGPDMAGDLRQFRGVGAYRGFVPYL